MKTSVRHLESSSQLRTHLIEYLQKQGYDVSEASKLLGRSGIEHTFDILAKKRDGFTSYAIAIETATAGDREEEANTVFSFANKAYDVGITSRVLVAIPQFTQEAKRLAQKQRIQVIDEARLEGLFSTGNTVQLHPDKPLRFETRPQLLESLVNLGYKVGESAIARGKSGVEYTFDVLASTGLDHVKRILGIDFITGLGEVELEQVSLFDTKAYDVGVDDKAIVVYGLSEKARQFAEQQNIRVLEIEKKPSVATLAEGADSQTQGASEAVKGSKPLRQIPEQEALRLIPEVTARKHNAIPLKVIGDTLHVAMADPTDIFALEALSAQSRMRITPWAYPAKEVRDAIDANYKGYGEIEKQIANINVLNAGNDESFAINAMIDTPLTQTLNLIVEEAVKARASDIHIEPEDDRLRVRYRIDGALQDMMSIPLTIHRSLLSRIKILSGLNIADHQHPQDGQFSTNTKGREIDIRVATAPTIWGEMAVLRLLDKSMAVMGLADLGFMADRLTKYEDMLKVAYGMILISGPTGAGKTTTLYASVNSLDKMGKNIITIEDPAEYHFKDINQIQVNTQAGITFAAGLRSILRLDPDVILVGEIRDADTANIAVQSALTGHLVLSSIHANDTPGVLFRLLDLKVEPFLIASSVVGVVAQRMVRRICPDCRQLIEVPVTEQLAYQRETGEKQTKFWYGTGCKSCAYTGYRGRVGIFEIMVVSDAVRTMLANQANTSDIRSQAVKEGMVSLMQDGMLKAKQGITTPSEVLRSAYSL